MKAALALMEQVTGEPKTIFQRPQTVWQVANDAEALHGFEKAREDSMPITTGRQRHTTCAQI